MMVGRSEPGAVALVGSGEYTAAMEPVDRLLVKMLGGVDRARVVVLPTASGLEPGMPDQWNARGVAHFQEIGARVTPARVVTRDDAFDEEVVGMLSIANFFYFSGGNPQYAVETWRDTPAWRCLTERHMHGAVVAGCSAGAMMLGGHTISIRSIAQGHSPSWAPALGLVPRIATLPHFDRMRMLAGDERLQAIVTTAPPDTTVVGVDEDTALVYHSRQWQVLGRQGISVFDRLGAVERYSTGQVVRKL